LRNCFLQPGLSVLVTQSLEAIPMKPHRTRTFTWQDPLPSAAAARTMSGIDFLRAIANGDIPIPPIGMTLDYQLLEVEPGRAVFGCQPAEFHYNPIGVVHGGLAATLCDSALGCAIQSMLPLGMAYTTIELHVNLVRALTRDTGYVRADAEAIHVGRQIGTAQARLSDAGGKLYAHATTTCLIFPLPESNK
jgi:uncharacterized protein (TIGR00369 family)